MIRRIREAMEIGASVGGTGEGAASEAGGGGLTDLATLTTEAIEAELEQRQKGLARLLREKARLRDRLAAIDRQVAQITGEDHGRPSLAPIPTPFRAPLSSLTVAEALARLYEIGAEFSPREATERLLDAGYNSKAANFRVVVSQVLTRETRFKRISRGLYQRIA